MGFGFVSLDSTDLPWGIQPLVESYRFGRFPLFPCDNHHPRIPSPTKLGDDPTQPDRKTVQLRYHI